MRKVSLIWATLVLVGWLSLPATAQEKSVAGKWTGTASGVAGRRQINQSFTMELVQNGQDVTGTYSTKFEGGSGPEAGREGTVRMTGTFTGNTLSLAFGKQGRLQASVNGATMTGSLERGNNHPLIVSAARAE